MMCAGKSVFIGCSTLLYVLVATPAMAGSVMIPGVSGGNFAVQVVSFKEARFSGVINQQYDYSCGSAAVASLLTYHYEDPVTEQEVFQAMYERGDKEKINKDGFSLLDMKIFLENRGYQADGFRLSMDKIAELGVPPIVLINTDGYLHFVVIKGMNKNEVLVGDPALGMRVLSRDEFESKWNGIFFLVRNRVDVARNHFNKENEWNVRAKAPFGTALSRAGLAGFTLSLPRRGDF